MSTETERKKQRDKQESTPDYKTFEDGINDVGKLRALFNDINDYVLISLVILGIADLYFAPDGWEFICILVLIFIWGTIRYILWPDEHRVRQRKKDD